MTDAHTQREPHDEDAAEPENSAASGAPADETVEAPVEGDTNTQDMSEFEDQLNDSELANALNRIAELEDEAARARADHYNLNQEYGNYVRRSKEAIPVYKEDGYVGVLEALIPVLDDIDAARKAGDLEDGPFASIATKLEEVLESRFGMVRYGAEGDDFDPSLHEALMAQTSADVDHPVVRQVLRSGYAKGERILRAAKVLVENPE